MRTTAIKSGFLKVKEGTAQSNRNSIGDEDFWILCEAGGAPQNRIQMRFARV